MRNASGQKSMQSHNARGGRDRVEEKWCLVIADVNDGTPRTAARVCKKLHCSVKACFCRQNRISSLCESSFPSSDGILALFLAASASTRARNSCPNTGAGFNVNALPVGHDNGLVTSNRDPVPRNDFFIVRDDCHTRV